MITNARDWVQENKDFNIVRRLELMEILNIKERKAFQRNSQLLKS